MPAVLRLPKPSLPHPQLPLRRIIDRLNVMHICKEYKLRGAEPPNYSRVKQAEPYQATLQSREACRKEQTYQTDLQEKVPCITLQALSLQSGAKRGLSASCAHGCAHVISGRIRVSAFRRVGGLPANTSWSYPSSTIYHISA